MNPARRSNNLSRNNKNASFKRKEGDNKNASFKKNERDDNRTSREDKTSFRKEGKRPSFRNKVIKRKIVESKPGMRINQFLAHSGISSRREADKLIAAGLVSVNGKIITEMGFRVLPKDTVKFNNETISSEKLQYLLLNKPKGYLVSDDPSKKKTVEEIINNINNVVFFMGAKIRLYLIISRLSLKVIL